MQIGLVCQGSVGDFLSQNVEETKDVWVFGFGGLGRVSYEQELRGKTHWLEDVAVASKKSNAVIVSGCITNTCGQLRKSALVAENGRILGVTDCTHALDTKFSCGAALRIYETKKGRMGVAVAEDLYFPQVMQTLVDCGSDFIVCPFEKMEGEMPMVLARAYAFSFGIPILFCADGCAAFALENGELRTSLQGEVLSASLQVHTEYHLIQTRRKGWRK